MLPGLHAAGYREPSPHSLSYPYLPVPAQDNIARRAGGFAFLRGMIQTYGHNGQ